MPNVCCFALQICPLVEQSVSSMNQFLNTLNGKLLLMERNNNILNIFLLLLDDVNVSYPSVMAPVDRHAEIAYPMVSSPEISNSAIVLNLKVGSSWSGSVTF